MRRYLLAIALFLALGTALTLTTAWISALTVGDILHGPSATAYLNPVGKWPAVSVTRGLTYEVVTLIERGGTLTSRYHVPAYPRQAWWPEESITTQAWAVAHGFPFPCLYSWRTTVWGVTRDKERVTQDRTIHCGVVPFDEPR